MPNTTSKDRPITRAAQVRIIIGLAVALLGLSACHSPVETSRRPRGSVPAAGPSDNGYQEPPVLTGATLGPGGRLTLVGWAEPGSRVRLASPDGQAVFAETDRQGDWRMIIAAPGEPRLFGLSMVDRGRPVQSEGYIVVTPHGTAAQLRAGAGAVVLQNRAPQLAILAVDFDSKGGTVVSGRSTPRGGLDLWVDGAHRERDVAAADGRFSLALDEPLSLADHNLEIVDGVRRAQAQPRLSLATPPARGPYRATITPSGWRIDWVTPGGGLQTTLLLSQDGRVS